MFAAEYTHSTGRAVEEETVRNIVGLVVKVRSQLKNTPNPSSPEEVKRYCQKQAAGDYRRLRICLSYFKNRPQIPEQPEPESKQPTETKKRPAYQMGERCSTRFTKWKRYDPKHKAFAVGIDGSCGWSYRCPNKDKAIADALRRCHASHSDCKIIASE
jgi:hypothetical protein